MKKSLNKLTQKQQKALLYLDQVMSEKDIGKLDRLMKVLRESGLGEKQINAAITKARNQVKKEQEE